MGFRVRTPDGELHYESFREVHNAYLSGLIEPDDQVMEDGTERWRVASSLPMLRDIPRKKSRALSAHTVFVIAVAIAALIAFFVLPWWASLILAVFAAISATSKTLQDASRPRR